MSRTQQVKRIIDEAGRPLSTNQIADELGVDWHTVKKELDELHERNEVHRSEVSDSMTLWWNQEIPI